MKEKETPRPVNSGVMLNLYPDSVGGTLGSAVRFLKMPGVKEAFSSLYILPSLFNTDLDRGFSVIDYGLNELLASREDLDEIHALNMDLKLDFILNHSSVLSKPFQDILEKGEASAYKDFFINWNTFWENRGVMTPEGYIQPDESLIKDMFFRKPGLPILMVRMPDGKKVPYWNTFYQEINYEPVDTQGLMRHMDIQYASAQQLAGLINSSLEQGLKPGDIPFVTFEKFKTQVLAMLELRVRYLGQMDLNVKSPMVWGYYEDTLEKLAGYGAAIVRLDAFAYASKEPGTRNFMNEPGTWELLERVRRMAQPRGLSLLLEIHSAYAEKTHEKVAAKGYMTYDFFLPGLILHALETGDASLLAFWGKEQHEKKLRMVNMLGCHDGIPLLDLKGLVPDDDIQKLIDVIVGRGGYIKNLHGQKDVYYQVNATYYSALGEDDKKMLLARAVQMFMPGKPQVWYLDLLAGKNDHDAVAKAGPGGHKEINRTNLSWQEAEDALRREVVQKQLELLRMRNTSPAFGFDAQMTLEQPAEHKLSIRWEKDGHTVQLNADFLSFDFSISENVQEK